MSKKKTAIIAGIIFYLCVQIPVGILGLKGIYLSDILSKRQKKEVVPVDIVLESGTYDLYDYTTGNIFGVLNIKKNSENADLIATLHTEKITGEDIDFKKQYAFESQNLIDIIFTKNSYDSIFYFLNKQEDKSMLIFNLEEKFYSEIPVAIKNNKQFFFITQVKTRKYDFLVSEQASTPLKSTLLYGMDDSMFSAFFVAN